MDHLAASTTRCRGSGVARRGAGRGGGCAGGGQYNSSTRWNLRQTPRLTTVTTCVTPGRGPPRRRRPPRGRSLGGSGRIYPEFEQLLNFRRFASIESLVFLAASAVARRRVRDRPQGSEGRHESPGLIPRRSRRTSPEWLKNISSFAAPNARRCLRAGKCTF